MPALQPPAMVIGEDVQLSWPGSLTLPATVHRLGRRSLGPVVDLVVDHADVAELGCGHLVFVASPTRPRFPSRVLHVETHWRTYGDRIMRSPSVVTLTPRVHLEEAMQPRRFVRVVCELEVSVSVRGEIRQGRCRLLSVRGLVAEFEAPLPRCSELPLTVHLPGGPVDVVGWVTTHDRVSNRDRLAVTFIDAPRVGDDLASFVLRQGYTPVPASLAG